MLQNVPKYHEILVCDWNPSPGYSYFRRSDGSTLVPGDLKIRCGDHDLEDADKEQFELQERDVETFTIHPYFTGSDESDAFALRNNVAVIHTKTYAIQETKMSSPRTITFILFA